MVFTDTGVTELITWLKGDSATAPTHIAIGTGNTSALKTDTTLENELTRSSIVSTLSGTDWVSFSVIIDATQQNGEDIYEFGLFNAATNGDMFQRTTHTVISKNSQIELEFEVRVRIQN